MTAPINTPWRGIYPPLVTPLSSSDTLDESGLRRLIDHALAGGVHGLFILGTTGEGPSLSGRLRRDMIRRSCEMVAGRVPVLVAISDTSLAESLALADFAAASGASAVVATAPSYFPLSQDDLWHYVKELAGGLSLPLFLYNMPSHSKVVFEIGTVRKSMELPNVIGIKDSSGTMTYFHELVGAARERPDWTVLVGPEELLAETVLLGGHGGVCGGANLFPHLYVNLYNAAAQGQLDQVRSLHAQVMNVVSAIYSLDNPPNGVIKGLKHALASLSICEARTAIPLTCADLGADLSIARKISELRGCDFHT